MVSVNAGGGTRQRFDSRVSTAEAKGMKEKEKGEKVRER